MQLMPRIALLSFIVFHVLAFRIGGSWAAEKSAKLAAVRIGYVSRSILDMPFIIARDRGYFREEGLEPEVKSRRRPRDRDDQPVERDLLHPRANGGGQRTEPQDAEVSVMKGGSDAANHEETAGILAFFGA